MRFLSEGWCRRPRLQHLQRVADSPARQRGQQCQDCHMKPTGQMTNIASRTRRD